MSYSFSVQKEDRMKMHMNLQALRNPNSQKPVKTIMVQRNKVSPYFH